ncbi:uncharacterized protein LOC101458493 [Ceratitis capitata]|uniref:uncharacterized protein LOC101458493 n=1 Tax=Ceratitis capitata TaxID=7213 RepID=UPI000329EFBF|nr:uncharacterized protein LOC101458493 [Ceratitis capitata]XP_023159105.1 uncharacterized protein LOC101458493 [Ceratitis capitata]
MRIEHKIHIHQAKMSLTDVLEMPQPKFSLRDAEAYTEDDILIYTICLDNIPKELTETEIYEFFTSYGPIKELKLFPRKNGRRYGLRRGTLQFLRSFSACSVIRDKRIVHIKGHLITVEPDGTWNQPDHDKLVNTEQPIFQNDLQVLENTTTIHAINNDCLQIILKNLTLPEQIRFGRVCEWFADAFSSYAKSRYKTCDLNVLNSMTLWYARDFFRFAGASFERFNGSLYCERGLEYVDYIQEYCSRLKELNLVNFIVHDEFIETLLHLTQLEKLTLIDNLEITGKYISEFVNLRELSLCGCGLKVVHMKEIVRNLPNLTVLDMTRTTIVTTDLIDEMVKFCQKLTVFKFAIKNYSYYRVAHLPSIKYLEIVEDHSGSSELSRTLQELAIHRADEMEILAFFSRSKITENEVKSIAKLQKLKVLDFGYSAINDSMAAMLCDLKELEELSIRRGMDLTNQGLYPLVKYCLRLYHLNIEDCREVSMVFAIEIIPLLKSTKHLRNKPLLLYANGSRISSYYLNSVYQYRSAALNTLIEIIFDDPPPQYPEDVNDCYRKYRYNNFLSSYNIIN